ncbi:MAG: pilus assembly PilX N-terminal domain-containing protein [Gemmatimonadales bacterium]|nr:pilus assembly PilX N-terminal domain-containing protein [Gemmatimonadales bacterium]
MCRKSDERGFALVAAVFGLVIISALVTGAFFAARQEMSVGRSSQGFQRAFGAAEAGLNTTIVQWNSGSWNALAVGDSAAVAGTLPGITGSYSGAVRRLNNELFVIRSLGQDPTGATQRTLAALVRLQLIQMNFNAALTTRGSVKIGGSSFIDGVDQNPTGWNCPLGALDTLAGITTRDSTSVDLTGCGGLTCLSGDPKINQDPTITDSTFFKFGDLDWNELVAMATKPYPVGAVGPIRPEAVGDVTTCTTTTLDNWGNPYLLSPPLGCLNYYPIIYVDGNLKLTGGYGQGILLVSGDLDVQGGFEFYGPVIIRGSLRTSGTGGHFNGGLMAANVDLELTSVLGDAVITYSSCAIARALQFNAPGRLLAQRSWAELF